MPWNFVYISLCLVAYGHFSAIQDRLRDGDFVWAGKVWKPKGNVRIPWKKDPWHLAKSMKQSCMYLALAIALDLPWWGLLLAVFIVFPVTQGRSFVLNYHTLLKAHPDQTIWEWIKGTILLKYK